MAATCITSRGMRRWRKFPAMVNSTMLVYPTHRADSSRSQYVFRTLRTTMAAATTQMTDTTSTRRMVRPSRR